MTVEEPEARQVFEYRRRHNLSLEQAFGIFKALAATDQDAIRRKRMARISALLGGCAAAVWLTALAEWVVLTA